MAALYMKEHVGVRCKPGTVRIRDGAIRRHINPAIGARAVASIRPRHVRDLHHRLVSVPAQANIVVTTLAQIFRFAADRGLAPEGFNPCAGVRLYRQGRRERFLTGSEFARIGRVLEEALEIGGVSREAVAAVRLLMLTGCRKNEILSLRWRDVDLRSGELWLRDAKTGPRAVPLSPAAVRVLESLPWRGSHPWVIPGRGTGTHMKKLGNAWRLLRERADLPDVRLHDLRHSFASCALALGESLPMISRLLGHQRIESTVRYAHLSRKDVHEAGNRVANSIAADVL